ncbi:MAG: YaiO family outer membrane beta-barrel protein [Cytophagaceae bacterium]|nr:YaiO family outer membrane beta-barrel protein [Cytophagaceae bacterium]MBL0300634.1 YaiO family outer membrane beta-barrel protein [Cytophagaceae bacterium]MBL0327577.1 YaiO family outer membrane beta-barrel protein [Cytophagaceae bacterium]
MKVFLKILFLLTISIYGVFAQENNFDPDSVFAQARKLAFDGKRNESIASLKNVIEKYPNYLDVRLFLSSVYGWEGKYKLAKNELEYLLSKEPKNKEFWISYIKNEIYADQPSFAINLANEALNLFPDSPELIILKATAQKNNSEFQKAHLTLLAFLSEYPENKEVRQFDDKIKADLATNSVGIIYSTDAYSQIYDPMHYYSLQYGKITPKGSLIARYNLNQKFGKYGSQFEFDAYPSITEGLYAYLNLGYSGSSIFPSWRLGAQLYKSLPQAYEVSLGIRSLKFGEEFTNIFTGSVGKYFGSSFLFAVPYLIKSDQGWSKSSTFTYRKYRANADQFFAVSAGIGFSPEINRFGFDSAFEPVINLKSQKFDISNNFKFLNNRNFIGAGFSVVHQESVFDPGKYFWIYSFRLSSQVRF